MKLQRLIAILTVLLQRERISAGTLAEKFGVSVRTVYRDMEALEQAGIPIVTHTGVNGGFAIMEQYKIDKKLFTHQDIATLLTSLYSVSGPLSGARVNQTLEKIKGLIPQEYGKSIELTSKQLYIDMTPWSANPLVTETMEKKTDPSGAGGEQAGPIRLPGAARDLLGPGGGAPPAGAQGEQLVSAGLVQAA